MRSTWLARLHLLAVYLAAFGWLLGASFHYTHIINRLAVGERHLGWRAAVGASVPVIAMIAYLYLSFWLSELAVRARLFPGRVLGTMSLTIVSAIFLGAGLGHQHLWPELESTILPLVGVGIGGLVILMIAFFRSPTKPAAPRFLRDKSHDANFHARRSLAAIALHALVVALAAGRALEFFGDPASFSVALLLFGSSYAAGIILSLLQQYPQRSMGLLPYATLLVSLGFVCAWIAPGAEWPLALLGVGAGLAHVAPRAWLVLLVPPAQRGGATYLALVAAIVGATVGAGLTLAVPAAALPAVRALIALALFVAAVWFLFRELFEQTLEFFLWVCYPVFGRGPGLLSCPTRGPVLVVANHAAWLDPIWLAKVIPVQLRPMMIARFFDLPVIRFLMTRVFYAIRVPEAGFRREAPEVQEAIAALDRGQNVLIFPEGWLKRKADTTVRRFGQGIYQILREKPQTPVVACWIEGNWGSYTSFFNGPPTKNKKMDWLRPIQIGVSDSEVLPLELLHDGHQTRRYLMQAVLQARRHLGLDPLRPPPFAAGEDNDEGA